MNNIMQALTNPQAFVNNVMNNNQLMSNPMVKNTMNLYKNNDVNGLKNLANNIAKEKGIDLNQFVQQFR